MIFQKEIIEIAERQKVPKSTIDKDWVLGHFLNAMYSFSDVKSNFVFKGGTCLKKCYFEEYRFSEDLDFTLLDKNFPVTKRWVNKIAKKAEQTCGAKFHLAELNQQESNGIPQGYEVVIKFWGADHKKNQPPLPVSRWQTKMKLDISFSEKLVQKPERKEIFHLYSDSNLITESVPVYSLNEIIAEKIRALNQRNRARDIYDIWYLSGNTSAYEISMVKRILLEKIKSKNLRISSIEDFREQETNNLPTLTRSFSF